MISIPDLFDNQELIDVSSSDHSSDSALDSDYETPDETASDLPELTTSSDSELEQGKPINTSYTSSKKPFFRNTKGVGKFKLWL